MKLAKLPFVKILFINLPKKKKSFFTIIDLDTQASLSYLLQNKNIDISKSLHQVIASNCKKNISKLIQSTKYENIDIIVGGESLRKTLRERFMVIKIDI